MVKYRCASVLLLFFAIVISASGCYSGAFRDPVLASLGRYESKEFYSEGAWQDFTDYGKYTFDGADPANSIYFAPLTEERKQTLEGYLDNFEQWVAVIRESDPEADLAAHYAFERSILSSDDYLYLYADPDYPEYGNYTLYFFDTETQTMYYFHNNI